MREAESMHTPSRRSFLGRLTGGAAVVAVAASVAEVSRGAPPALAVNPPPAPAPLTRDGIAVFRIGGKAYLVDTEDHRLHDGDFGMVVYSGGLVAATVRDSTPGVPGYTECIRRGLIDVPFKAPIVGCRAGVQIIGRIIQATQS
jgi:hypothetical protein